MITVYSKSGHCRYCEAVKARFVKEGLGFEDRLLDDRVVAIARLKGWRSAPIVVSDTHPELDFSGAPQDKLDAFVEAHKQ